MDSSECRIAAVHPVSYPHHGNAAWSHTPSGNAYGAAPAFHSCFFHVRSLCPVTLKCFPRGSLCVIDEAAMALEVSCWIPIMRSKRLVLAGDHCQLAPTIMSQEAEAMGLGTTLFDRVVAKYPLCVRMLSTQYRMNSQISDWSSKAMYDGLLESGESVIIAERSHPFNAPLLPSFPLLPPHSPLFIPPSLHPFLSSPSLSPSLLLSISFFPLAALLSNLLGKDVPPAFSAYSRHHAPRWP